MREIFEHTADAGIRAESSTLSEAFHEVSLAFTEIITGGSLPDTKNNFEINIESSSLDSLLVNYISHLIYLFDTENFLVSSVEVSIKSGLSNTVSGILKGDFYNEAIHGYGVEIEGPPSKIVVILDL